MFYSVNHRRTRRGARETDKYSTTAAQSSDWDRRRGASYTTDKGREEYAEWALLATALRAKRSKEKGREDPQLHKPASIDNRGHPASRKEPARRQQRSYHMSQQLVAALARERHTRQGRQCCSYPRRATRVGAMMSGGGRGRARRRERYLEFKF